MDMSTYRAKSLSNGEWVQGSYRHYDDMVDHGKDDCDYIIGRHNGEHFPFVKVDPKTLGRYSGFNDKFGEPIFAGDIVDIINEAGVLIHAECKEGIFNRKMSTGVECLISGFAFFVNGFPTFPVAKNYKGVPDNEMFEIVGNIYDNPGALQGLMKMKWPS